MRLSAPIFFLVTVSSAALAAELPASMPPAAVVPAAGAPKAEPAVKTDDALRTRIASLRQDAQRQREELARSDAQRSAACYGKVLVNSCLEDARQERLRVEGNARKQELEASRIERKLKADEWAAHLATLDSREARAAEATRRKQEHEQMVKEFEAGRSIDMDTRAPTKASAAAQQSKLTAFEAGQVAEQARLASSQQRAASAQEQMSRHRAQMQLQPARLNKVKEAEKALDHGPKVQTEPVAAGTKP